MLTTDARERIVAALTQRWLEDGDLSPFVTQLKNRPALAMHTALKIGSEHGQVEMGRFLGYIAKNPALYDGERA